MLIFFEIKRFLKVTFSHMVLSPRLTYVFFCQLSKCDLNQVNIYPKNRRRLSIRVKRVKAAQV